VVVGEVVIHWIHRGAGSSGRSRRQTPGRTVSSVDELALTKTLASITLPVSKVVIAIRTALAAGKREFPASRESGSRVGRGRVTASILRLGSARESRPGDTLVGFRVGELGRCGVHLRASGTVEGDNPGDIAMLPSRTTPQGCRTPRRPVDDSATPQRSLS